MEIWKYKIAIIGPESTGKSTLSKQLADYFGEPYVEEFAREYIGKRNGRYNRGDLDTMLLTQLEKERQLLNDSHFFLFCDTNAISFKVWSDYKYGTCSSYIENQCNVISYNFQLLLRPDLPYENDSLRETPDPQERIQLFEMFQKELVLREIDYAVIEGLHEDRLNNAITILKNHFSI